MNRFLKKAAAVMTAGILTASAMGMTAFADEAKLIYSTEASVSYNAAVAKPVFSVKGSKGVRQIKLTTTTKGASIYYTTNGSTPTTKSKKLASNSLIQIKKKTTIKAIAVSGSSKSAVMTKTFSVDTIPGDVTGDGNINSSDYTRLKNYLNGKTTYICKDNADVSGDGSVAKKDLTLISQYLNGQIKKFPASGSTSSSSVTAPTSTVTSTYGGKNIELKCSDSSAKIYYTTNGKTPTSSSTLYKSKFLVTKDTTVKFISYKSGKSSSVQSRSVSVSQCKSVTSDTPTNKEYDKPITIKLSCPTNSSTKIYYTLDGSNPTSSYSAMLYGSSGIDLSKDTVVKVYARAKGYADSNVTTFNYKVKSDEYFKISGSVWDDTPNETSTPDGKRNSGESGINGIKVYLLNTGKNTYEASTTTTTINGVVGSYSFDKAVKGQKYKVVFQFNGQKYRAYDYITSGGNQATSSTISASNMLTIDNAGARNAGGTLISSTNSYSKAITSSNFDMTATTNYTYDSEVKEVNCALVSTIYGNMRLSLVPTYIGDTVFTNTATVNSGNTVRYKLTVYNESPSATLSSVEIRLYAHAKFNSDSLLVNNYRVNGTKNGDYYVYDVTNVLSQTISKGNYADIIIQATVGNNVSSGEKLPIYAQVTKYKYANSAFDKGSIPGNLTVPPSRTLERDEASATITVSGTNKEMTTDFPATLNIEKGKTAELHVKIKNGDQFNPEGDLEVNWGSNKDYVNMRSSSTYSNGTATVTYYFEAVQPTSAGVTLSFSVKLKNSTTTASTKITVSAPPMTISTNTDRITFEDGQSGTITITVENPINASDPIIESISGGLYISGKTSFTSVSGRPNAYQATYTIERGAAPVGYDCSITFSANNTNGVAVQSKTVTVNVSAKPDPNPAPATP